MQFFVDCITVPSSYAVLMFLLHFLTSLRGSAWANTLSQNMQTILLFLYVWWKKIHHETWGGRAHLLGGLLGTCFEKATWRKGGVFTQIRSSPPPPTGLLVLIVPLESLETFQSNPFSLRSQDGPGTACRSGARSSAWPSPAC